MAGWGDDPVLAELRAAIESGWEPVAIREDRETPGGPYDVVTVRLGEEEREFRSDHLAFHRYVEGLMEDHGLSYA
ncbi:MAG: hypothetical protein HY658_09485 [Actinobacteria bacterium]|nr:hypothetical protein [Actinomycetota bacterium]